MTRFFLSHVRNVCLGLFSLAFLASGALAQSTVSVIGPITPGDCAVFNSTTVIKDSGGTGCTGTGAGIPGGTNGQIQYNNSGNFGGFTASGDATINTATGAVGITGNAVTNAKSAQMPANTFKCNPTGALANAQDCAQQAALNAIMCTPTRAGDIAFWNGSNWVCLAGNNSATQVLSENASGVPSWTTPASGVFIQNYLAGLITANDTTADQSNEIAVAAGIAADSTNVDYIVLNAALSRKKINVAWAAGSNAGCLDTGAVASNSYFVWLIKNVTGPVVDVLCSLSPSAPTMPGSFTEKRRIGWVVRQTSTFTGSVSGTALTVASGLAGVVQLGGLCTGTGITANSIITAYGTGVGGVGTYTLSQSSAATGSISITCTGNLQFTQNGNVFRLLAAQHDIVAQSGLASGANFTLASVPIGIVVQVNGVGCAFTSGALSNANIYSPSDNDQAVGFGVFENLRDPTTASAGMCVPINGVFTNATAQIRARTGAAGTTVDWDTLSVIDTRGQ